MVKVKHTDGIKFSIIIPMYNSKMYLAKTIISLVDQTYKNFEVIAVDDHSTDGSLRLAEHLLSLYSLEGKVIPKPSNIKNGVSTTRNIAVDYAQGDWLIFLDSDDIFHSKKLEIVNNFIASNAECQALHHGYIQFSDDSEIKDVPIITESPVKTINTSQLIVGNQICTSSVGLLKSLFSKHNGFNPFLNGVEDYFLWLQISVKTQWYYINSTLTYYRISNTSLMGGRKLAHYVEQNSRLYSQVAKANLLSMDQLRIFYSSLFYTDMVYFISKTNRCSDFLEGLLQMLRRYLFRPFLFFSFRQIKTQILIFLSNMRGTRKRE